MPGPKRSRIEVLSDEAKLALRIFSENANLSSYNLFSNGRRGNIETSVAELHDSIRNLKKGGEYSFQGKNIRKFQLESYLEKIKDEFLDSKEIASLNFMQLKKLTSIQAEIMLGEEIYRKKKFLTHINTNKYSETDVLKICLTSHTVTEATLKLRSGYGTLQAYLKKRYKFEPGDRIFAKTQERLNDLLNTKDSKFSDHAITQTCEDFIKIYKKNASSSSQYQVFEPQKVSAEENEWEKCMQQLSLDNVLTGLDDGWRIAQQSSMESTTDDVWLTTQPQQLTSTTTTTTTVTTTTTTTTITNPSINNFSFFAHQPTAHLIEQLSLESQAKNKLMLTNEEGHTFDQLEFEIESKKRREELERILVRQQECVDQRLEQFAKKLKK